MMLSDSINLHLPKKGLHIAHVNVNSLANKVDEVLNVVQRNNLHVLAITETHLDQTITNGQIELRGYNIIRKDRNRRGGGVAIYIQEHLLFKVRDDLCVNGLEILWIQIHLPFQQPTLIGCIYRPPKSDALYLDKICESIDLALDDRKELFMLGDYNIGWKSKHSDGNKTKFTQYIESRNLYQMVQDVTRSSRNKFGHKTESIIDLIFSNDPNKCSNAKSALVSWTDHNIVYITKYTKVPKRPPRVIVKRSFKKFVLEDYQGDLAAVPWDLVYLEDDLDCAVDCFTKLFTNVIELHAPIRKCTIKAKPSPWIDQQLREAISQRDEAKIIASRSGLDSDIMIYRKYRNFVVKLNRQKKTLYYNTAFEECRNNSKQIWHTVNGLLGRSNSVSPVSVEVDGKISTKPMDIANHFADYFESKINDLRSHMISNVSNELLVGKIDNKIMKGKNCSFVLPDTSVDEIEKILSSLPDDKSPGYDLIDNKLLKYAAPYIMRPVKYLFNLSLQQGVFPTEWKHAKICPIPKDAKISFTASNSRPISLFSSLSKILERVVSHHIWKYMESNNLLTRAQHAYRKNHSTETALIDMTDEWLSALDQGKLVSLLLLDFTAAFDLIDHTILLKKLTHYGFSENAINWMSSYLNGRKESIYVNGSFSSPRTLTCGIPQGSCLGPLLFIIYTNDFPLVLANSNAHMFADDTTITAAADSQTRLYEYLSNDFKSVIKWVENNKLVLNVIKTKYMIICTTRKRRKLKPWHLTYGSVHIEEATEVKLLGVRKQNNLSWAAHITDLSKRVMKMAGMIGRIVKFLSKDTLKVICHSLIYSHISYCCAVWGNAALRDMRRLQITLNKAARMVLRCGFEKAVSELHAMMGWPTVVEHVRQHSIALISKIQKFSKPVSIKDKLLLVREKHQVNVRIRDKNHYVLPKIKTEMGRRTFIFRTIKLWNSLQ